jgi:hypothetical protein
VKVQRVEVKDIRLPKQLQRAMAAEAEVNNIKLQFSLFLFPKIFHFKQYAPFIRQF